VIWLASIAQASAAPLPHLYLPSADQARIDRSFSMIAINTPLIVARPRLKEDRQPACGGTCDWVDKDGVRYSFAGESADRRYLVAKTVRASDYVWKAIPALGIGQARDRALVMAAVQRFMRGAPFDCSGPAGTPSPVTCRAPLKPGSVTITFDAAGKLIEARFVGYAAP